MTDTPTTTADSEPAAAEPAPAPAPAAAARRRSDTALVTALAVVVALVVGAVLIALSDSAVLDAFGYFFAAPGDVLSASWSAISDAYAAMFQGAIVNPDSISAAADGQATWSSVFGPLSETIVTATPLIFAGLSVALAFRGGLFNIGGEGQVVVGAITAGYVGFAWHLPPVLHVTAAVLAGMIGGGVWGLIAGLFKARTGAHEVITTIMLNYIALYLLLYLLGTPRFQRPGRSDAISREVDGDARLPHLAGSALRLHAGILLALVAAALVAWLLNRSTLGFGCARSARTRTRRGPPG